MSAEDYNVSGLYLRGYLAGMRKISGSQYPKLLEQVGLKQYATKYPPATADPVIKSAQLIRLNQIINETIGDDLFQLFTRNLGREFGKIAANSPYLMTAIKPINLAVENIDIYRLLELVVAFNKHSIDEQVEIKAGDTPGSYYLIYHDCMYCAGRDSSAKPGCPGVTAFYREVLQGVTNRRIQVTETLCGASEGQGDCHFLVNL